MVALFLEWRTLPEKWLKSSANSHPALCEMCFLACLNPQSLLKTLSSLWFLGVTQQPHLLWSIPIPHHD